MPGQINLDQAIYYDSLRIAIGTEGNTNLLDHSDEDNYKG
jgi:hypothetical protein